MKMKIYQALLVALCSGYMAQAQLVIKGAPQRVTGRATLPAAASITLKSTAKTTGAVPRLIGIANYKYSAGGGYALVDTAGVTWSGTRGTWRTEELRSPLKNERLDSFDTYIIWQAPGGPGTRKNMKTYDADGNVTAEYSFEWNTTTGTWDSTYAAISTFVTKRITTFLQRSADILPGRLTDVWRETYHYTGSDVDILSENTTGPGGSWANVGLTHESGGAYPTSRLLKSWNPGTSTWENSSRETIMYSGVNVNSLFIEMWKAGAWEGISQYKAVFAGPKLLSDSLTIWNTGTGSWEPLSYFQYRYAGTDMTDALQAFWDASTAQWALKSFTYNYAGSNPVGVIVRNQDPVSGIWNDESREEYKYDIGDNMTEVIKEEWTGTAWQPYEGFYAHSYFYYEVTAGIPAVNAWLHQATVYPNPAGAAQVYVDYFTERADATEVVLTNTLGQVVHRSAEGGSIGDHSVKVPVNALAPGVYFVCIYSGGQLCQTLKLLR